MHNGPSTKWSKIWTSILVILMIWGTLWSYYRHGPEVGDKATNNGIYALYKGIASMWEQPEWQDDYDKQTQAIGIIIGRSNNPTKEAAEQKKTTLGEFRRWAIKVPKDDLNELKATTKEFALAQEEYSQIHYFAAIDRISLKEAKEYPQIQKRVEKFEKVPRFGMLWKLHTELELNYKFSSLSEGEPARLAADADPASVKKHLEKIYEDKKEKILRLVEEIYDISPIARSDHKILKEDSKTKTAIALGFMEAAMAASKKDNYLLAVEESTKGIDAVPRSEAPKLWALLQKIRANNFQMLSLEFDGEKQKHFLQEAAASFKQALEFFTQQSNAEEWASVHQDLGSCFWLISLLSHGLEKERFMSEAESALQSALQHYTQVAFPEEWAATQKKLGDVFMGQAEHASGEEGVGKFRQSIVAFRESLKISLEHSSPEVWAEIQDSLGNALYGQGVRSAGLEADRLLVESASALESALKIFTKVARPLYWAGTQNTLGNTYDARSLVVSDPDVAKKLRNDAVVAYRAALEVWSKMDKDENWSKIQYILGSLLTRIAIEKSGADSLRLLQEAISAFRAAAIGTGKSDAIRAIRAHIDLGFALETYGDRSEVNVERRSHWVEAEKAYQTAFELSLGKHPDDLTQLAEAIRKIKLKSKQ